MNTKYKTIGAIITLLIALLSFTVVGDYASSTTTHNTTITKLDDKKKTVMELTAASTAASAAITVLPGDTGTPIAEKLADLSGYFLIIFLAIYLEKFLITVLGYAAFKVLIPIALIVIAICFFYNNHSLRIAAIKLIIFSLLLYSVIPTSVEISDLVEANYQASIDNTIKAAKKNTDSITKSNKQKKSSKNDNWFDKAKKTIDNTVDQASQTINMSIDSLKNMLNNFIDAIAVLMVTTCLIPIGVILFFIWIMKLMLGIKIEFKMPHGSNIVKKYKSHHKTLE